MLSPNFQVANFEVEEYNNTAISISYKFKGSDKVITKELFKAGSSFPSTKSVTFDNKTGKTDLIVHYAEDAGLMKGLPTQIAQYDIGEQKVGEKCEKHAFTMRLSNNIHNIASLDECELVQEWSEQEKIPIKASPVSTPVAKKEDEKKDGEAKPEEPVKQPEQQYEMKERKKKNFTPIPFTTSSFALAPAVRKSFMDLENSLT